MASPKRVKEQAEKARQLQQQLIESKQAPAEPATVNTDPPADPPATPAPAEVEPENPPELGAIDNPPPAEPTEKGGPETDPDYWKKRFVNFKKAHDEEVPQLRRDLKSAMERLDSQERELAELREKANQTPAAPEPSDAPLITDADIKEYGEDLIDLVARVSKDSVTKTDLAKQILDLSKRVESLANQQQEIQGEVKTTARQDYLRELTRLVPNWRELNKDVDFIAWLSEPVPGTAGLERQHFLTEADANLDYRRVASFFLDWMKQSKQTASDPSKGREHHVAPDNGGAGGNPPPAPSEETFTRADIKKFYDDKAHGVYRGKEEQARSIELKLNAAIREGRIVDA